MRSREFIQEQAGLRAVTLVLKSSESRPGYFRIIDRDSRDILGTIHNIADLTRLIDPQRMMGGSVTILIPPALQRQYPDFVASIKQFAQSISRVQRRPVSVQIMGQPMQEQGSNANTARSIAQDIHSYIGDLNFHISQHGRDQHFQQLKSEVQGMLQDLENLGYEYDPDRPDHMRPLTLANQPQQKLSETPLPPEAIEQLKKYRDALNQPGLQISGPDVQDFLAGMQYPQLKQQIQNLQRLMALFVEFERLADRADRSKLGLDRGTAADLEVIRNWPVPETDRDIAEYTQKLAQGIQLLKGYLQRKRMVWR